jgi:D-alanyl-D-alanine carboxypeptidase (penicillin-binding protein 5/6)
MRFISVIFNASSEGIRQKDSEALLNFAFRNYCLETVFTAGEIVATTAVSKGEEKEIQLEVGNDTEVVIPYDRKDDLEIRMDVPEIVTSPVSKGTPLGKVEIILDGTVLKEEPLLASDDVARAGHLTLFWRSLSGFVSSLWTQLIEKIQNVLPW